jgi:phospholipid-transporting ATPase
LRGSSLQNTEWIIGIVVFTGHETKIMKNSVNSKGKQSKIERMTNIYIFLMVAIQAAVCLVATVYNIVWLKIHENTVTYLEIPLIDYYNEIAVLSLIQFGTWFLTFMNFVPISLLVTLEFVKFLQAYFMGEDAEMYDLEKDLPCKVQSSNLNEELGVCNAIFSDKTGTLTQNIMDFKKFTAGDQSYGESHSGKIELEPGVTNVNIICRKYEKDRAQNINTHYLDKMMEILAVCHTVITEDREGG